MHANILPSQGASMAIPLSQAATMVQRLYMEFVMANMTDGRRGFWVVARTPTSSGLEVVPVDGPKADLRKQVVSDAVRMVNAHSQESTNPSQSYDGSAIVHREGITVAVIGLDPKINKVLAEVFLAVLDMAY